MKKLVNVIENISKYYSLGMWGWYSLGVFVMAITNDNVAWLADMFCDIVNGWPVIEYSLMFAPLVYWVIVLGKVVTRVVKKHRNK